MGFRDRGRRTASVVATALADGVRHVWSATEDGRTVLFLQTEPTASVGIPVATVF
jgi:hypothetical protein